MGRRVIDGPDRSRFLINVPTGILIDIWSKDITPAIGSVNSPTFTGTSLSSLLITMSANFSFIFNNEVRAEGMCSVRAARGSGRYHSLLDHNQGQAARCAVANREVTPFDFNIGRYQVSPSLDTLSCSCETDLQSLGVSGRRREPVSRCPGLLWEVVGGVARRGVRRPLPRRLHYGSGPSAKEEVGQDYHSLGARGYIISGYIVI